MKMSTFLVGFNGFLPSSRRFRRYKRYDHRLQTFKKWPIGIGISAQSLTDAGFYYTGKGDICRCYACGATVSQCKDIEEYCARHKELQEDCPHIKLMGLVHNANTRKDNSGKKDSKQGICKVCNSKEANIVFLPCAHVSACDSCSDTQQGRTCPHCDNLFSSKTKIFLYNL